MRWIPGAGIQRREIGWYAEWFGHRLEASVVPDSGRTHVKLQQSVRGMARAIVGGIVGTATVVLGPVASVVSARMMDRPTPDWVSDLGISLFVSRGDLGLIALSVGVAVAISSVPLSRIVVRRMRRLHESRLHLLNEAVTANVSLAINEDAKEAS